MKKKKKRKTKPNFPPSLIISINTTRGSPHYYCSTLIEKFILSVVLFWLFFFGVMMMKILSLILVFSLLSNGSLLGIMVEARPLNMVGTAVAEDFFAGLSLGAIKQSGPSPGGDGHAFTNVDTLGGIKDSGPSPGVGHSQVSGQHH